MMEIKTTLSGLILSGSTYISGTLNIQTGSFAAITVNTPASDESITMWKTNVPLTAQSIFYGIRGSGSVSASIRFSSGSNFDVRGTDIAILPTIVTNTSSGHFVSSLNNTSIASGSWIFLVISGTVVGTPTELNATLYYY